MSVTKQIRDVLSATEEALTAAQLCDRCSEARDAAQVATLCYCMVRSGVLTREKPVSGGPYRYQLTISGTGAAMADLEASEEDATEARASRVTPSEKPNGSGLRLLAQTRSRRRSVALPVTAKAAPPRLGPSARVRAEADLQIALTDQDILALRRGELVLYLSPEERAGMEAFIGKFSHEI